jgi:hypothetical protein
MQPGTLLLGARLRVVSAARERHGVVSGFGQKGGGLLQLHIAVGQLAQGHLSGERLAVGLRTQAGEQRGRGGVGRLLQGGIQLARRGGKLRKGMPVAGVQQVLVLLRPHVVLDGKAQYDRKGRRQKAGRPDPRPAAPVASSIHKNALLWR